jgi:prevent-host-death family protein
MPDVGVRELKTHASEILRRVRQHRTRYIITYRGRPVAILAPLEVAAQDRALPCGDAAHGAWDELTRLGEEIGRGWQSPLTSAELLSQIRR